MKLLYPLKVNEIVQKFGENPDIYKQFGLKGHDGIDFRTKNQSDADGIAGHTFVYAAADGTIETLRNDGSKGYGLHIRIRHDNHDLTIYGHLSSSLVKQGDRVEAGQKIGVTGSSGFSTGPHLHFEYRPSGESVSNGYAGAVDPLPFLTMNTTSTNPIIPPEDPELTEAKMWAQEHKIMGMTALDQPMLRQDVLRVIYRLATLLKK